MADRLIYAGKLKAHYAWWKGGTREMTMDEAKSDFDTIIDLQPTVDPIKHGRWIEIEGGEEPFYFRCSECNRRSDFKEHYCPNCGAKMDEVEE